MVPESNLLSVGIMFALFWRMGSQLLRQKNQKSEKLVKLLAYFQIQVESKIVTVLKAEQVASVTCTFGSCSGHPCLGHFRIVV